MAVFVLVGDGAPPPREEVAKAGAHDDAETQVDVVGHEHQHQAVAEEDLHPMQHRLQAVEARAQSSSGFVDTQGCEVSSCVFVRQLSTHRGEGSSSCSSSSNDNNNDNNNNDNNNITIIIIELKVLSLRGAGSSAGPNIAGHGTLIT